MPNIVLSRIDECLLHGPAGMKWAGFAGANPVLVQGVPTEPAPDIFTLL